jgi:hypothetical protein
MSRRLQINIDTNSIAEANKLFSDDYFDFVVTKHAAWPTTRSPSFNNVGLGCHPAAKRTAKSSLALGT